MAFWASAAWGREALEVGVETSKRLDVSVKAQLVGACMGPSAVERSNASWMAGLGHTEGPAPRLPNRTHTEVLIPQKGWITGAKRPQQTEPNTPAISWLHMDLPRK